MGLAALLTGCSGDDAGRLPAYTPAASPRSATSTPTPDATPKAASSATGAAGVVDVTVKARGKLPAEGKAIIATMRGYITDMAAVLADPSTDVASRWATPAGQAEIRSRAVSARKAQERYVGPVVVSGEVSVPVRGKGKGQGSLAIFDGCLDQSKMRTVDRSGKRRRVSGGKRVPIRATLVGARDQWLVDSFDVPDKASC